MTFIKSSKILIELFIVFKSSSLFFNLGTINSSIESDIYKNGKRQLLQ